VSSIFYQRENRIYLLSFLWIYNDLYVITSHKSMSLDFLMKKYFSTPYWPIKFKSLKIFVPYFYYSKVFQIFNSTQYKPNGQHHGFKMKFKVKWNLFSCVFMKICLFLNLIFFHQLFLYKIPCFHPKIWKANTSQSLYPILLFFIFCLDFISFQSNLLSWW
jgi:hypothetical protein